MNNFKMTFLISKLTLIFAAVLCIGACSCQNTMNIPTNHSPIIVAHRGGAGLGMENSLSCIEKGIQAGADMVEIDIHLTADNQLVVCHDQTINRTTNGKGKIEKMTLPEIQQYRLLDEEGQPSDETLPTLGQVLALCKGRCNILLEIKKRKDQYVGIEALADSLVKQYEMQNQVVFQSFNDDVLFKLHALDPSLRLEKLLFYKAGNLVFDGTFTSYSAEKYGFVASFNIMNAFASRKFIRKMHEAGKEVKVWTVDKPKRVPESVDGIITNRPDLF